MASENESPSQRHQPDIEPEKRPEPDIVGKSRWKRMLSRSNPAQESIISRESSGGIEEMKRRPEKWSMGVLNDTQTDEVPGSVLLMSHSKRNEPLGLRNAPANVSASSLPSPFPPETRPPVTRKESERSVEEQQKTKDGKIILEPQPDKSMNDPLNWPSWRRDVALLSLGFFCMLGGGMTPILAAGFDNVADTYHVSVPQVALTTGFYMLGLGIGSVIASPTAILFGKRPVYLGAIILFIISAIWCAASPNYASLVVARVFMGLAVSPCECLPSATIAEIFFLHERAYRLGIYTLLLLGGKNLIPLVSAAIIQGLSWRWVFWIVAIVVGFCFFAMFFFVPETFWDRTPRPHKPRKSTFPSLTNFFHHHDHSHAEKATSSHGVDGSSDMRKLAIGNAAWRAESGPVTIAERRLQKKKHHVGFADTDQTTEGSGEGIAGAVISDADVQATETDNSEHLHENGTMSEKEPVEMSNTTVPGISSANREVAPQAEVPQSNTPHHMSEKGGKVGYLDHNDEERNISTAPSMTPKSEPATPAISTPAISTPAISTPAISTPAISTPAISTPAISTPAISTPAISTPAISTPAGPSQYTNHFRTQPPKTFRQTLRPWNGRLRQENWFKVALRPFILFAYPAILWSTLVYSLSVGWLIVLSESVSHIYRNKETYNFSALQTGLVYLSPFIGGVLGTAVAGKVSDIIVRFMSRRNGGIYEPEFRLVMAIPVMIATCIGLMGFGWSAAEKDNWIVPTLFFGVISFGCSLGSTTSITFAVDSYRQYAGEALVTLNFSKNVFHGLVFSLFFNRWLEADGSKDVFLAIGGIQIACLLTTVPMYIYGKRARMWTVRRNLMEKF